MNLLAGSILHSVCFEEQYHQFYQHSALGSHSMRWSNLYFFTLFDGLAFPQRSPELQQHYVMKPLYLDVNTL